METNHKKIRRRKTKDLAYESLLLLGREGDENALKTLFKSIDARRDIYINTALVDNPHHFSKQERDQVFYMAYHEAENDYCYQGTCSFLSYLILKMRYTFYNLAKTKAEFAASIEVNGFKQPSSELLRDCVQEDRNDLMRTLFTWKNDIVALASRSNKFSPRDIRVINKRLDNVPFTQIAKEEQCSLSTAKKVWKKFIEYAKMILNVQTEKVAVAG